MIEINGMAHIILAVSEWEQCKEFYEALLPFLGLKRVFSGRDSIYYVGGRTAVGRFALAAATITAGGFRLCFLSYLDAGSNRGFLVLRRLFSDWRDWIGGLRQPRHARPDG